MKHARLITSWVANTRVRLLSLNMTLNHRQAHYKDYRESEIGVCKEGKYDTRPFTQQYK